ncbi:HAMP domain-containing histidine kinase [bacterium]|nr:HAMP domain-containing histidine kinase [bacterium]
MGYINLELYHLINKLFIVLIDIFGAWLIFWVYTADSRNKTNQLFSLFTFSTLLWVNAGYFLTFSSKPESALFWARFAPSAVFVFLTFFYFFTVYFPREEKRYFFLEKIILVITFFLVVVTFFSDRIVQKIEFTTWGVNPIFTPSGKIIFYGIVIVVTFLIVTFLLKKYITLSRREKVRIQYLLIGLLIFVLMNLVFNVFLPLFQNSIKYWQFGNYSAIFLLGFTAYAIVKRELFGIRVVITAIFVALIAILLALDALVFTDILSLQLVKGLILILFLYFGYLMIKSVIREIEQRQEIEKLSKAKSEFISIASHQLRTPLTAIKGYISMILEGTYGKVNPKIRSPMKKVYESNERLIALVNNLLSISRIESGKMAFNPEETSIEDLISEVIDIFRIEAKKKKLYLRFEKPARPLPKVFVDREKMVDVLSNVVSNCIKYTLKGGVTIKAEEIKDKVNKIRVTISDTGEGMTEEELSKMFQSFSRGMAGTKLYTQGAGLGLYVARKYMEMHKGKIWAESEGKGKGSTFYIELPTK